MAEDPQSRAPGDPGEDAAGPHAEHEPERRTSDPDARPPEELGGGPAPGGDPGPGAGPAGWAFVRLAVLFYTGLLLLAVLWRTAWAGEPIAYAGPAAAAQGLDPAADLAAGLLAGLLVILLSHAFTRFTRAGEELARAMARVVGPLSLPQCLLLALVSSVSEEAFFRGALQPRVGLVLASLLFGLAHFVPRRELLAWAVFSLGVGLLLGALFEQTGNLLAPIAAHALVNAVNLPILVRRYARG